MVDWRLAGSLIKLRSQINAISPNRGKGADGTIGNLEHAVRTSDHNPNSQGVVRAMDVTHDPSRGFDSYKFADMLRRKRDPRILTVISNGRIFSSEVSPWTWRRYTGKNSHSQHVHISVGIYAQLYDDSSNWDIDGDWDDGRDSPPMPETTPILMRGSRGPYVSKLQTLLGMGQSDRDGFFGPKTEAAVKALQTRAHLVVDGKVGAYTWEALLHITGDKT